MEIFCKDIEAWVLTMQYLLRYSRTTGDLFFNNFSRKGDTIEDVIQRQLAFETTAWSDLFNLYADLDNKLKKFAPEHYTQGIALMHSAATTKTQEDFTVWIESLCQILTDMAKTIKSHKEYGYVS